MKLIQQLVKGLASVYTRLASLINYIQIIRKIKTALFERSKVESLMNVTSFNIVE